MSTVTSPSTAGSPRRLRLMAALTAACVLLLTACGARIDTVFTLNDGPTGTRTMTLTLSRSDLDQYVVGGTEALEASIQAHRPAGIDYSGLTLTDENLTATFTITFDSADAYREKVTSVLAAGGYEGTPTIGLTTEDSLFLRGAAIEEDFTSVDLLAWLREGLVADGTVSADNKGDIFESGDTDVVYRGETTSSYQPISFTELTDHGVSDVNLTTWLHADGTFERAIDIRMPLDSYEADAEAFDAYFADATPDGGDLVVSEADGWSVGWLMTFIASDAAELQTMTDQALGSQDTQFSMSEEADADNPTRRLSSVVDIVNCDAICSPDASGITSTLIAPAGWEVTSSSADATTEITEEGVAITHRPSSTPIEFEHAIPFESIHVDTTVGFDHSIDQTLTFTVTDEDATAAGDGFLSLLTGDGLDAPTVSSADGMTSYVLTVTADDAESYTAAISQLAPGAYLSVYPDNGDGFWWSRYRAELYLGLGSSVAAGGVRSPITYETHVPFAHSISRADSQLGTDGSVDGRTATAVENSPMEPYSSVAFSGPTLGLYIVAGVLLLIGLVAVVAMVIFRKRISTAIDAWGERRAARKELQAAAALAAPAAPTYDLAAMPVSSPPGVLAGPTVTVPHDQFSEADLV